MQREFVGIARAEQVREIGEAGEQVDDAKAADRAAHEVVREDRAAAPASFIAK